jgi:hypothetical protein
MTPLIVMVTRDPDVADHVIVGVDVGIYIGVDDAYIGLTTGTRRVMTLIPSITAVYGHAHIKLVCPHVSKIPLILYIPGAEKYPERVRDLVPILGFTSRLSIR